MTDHPDLDPTERHVRRAFAAELRQAATDLEVTPMRVPEYLAQRRPSLRARATVVAFAAVAVVAALGVGAFLNHVRTPAVAGPTADQQTGSTDDARYSDGIPMFWDGQPVLRWTDALAQRRTATDKTPFLTGVWLNIEGVHSCPAPGCDPAIIGGDAGATPTPESGVYEFPGGLTLSPGAAILRVHTRAPLSSECDSAQQTCLRILVVDSVLWAGDFLTAPRPFSVDQVIAATPGATLTSGRVACGLPVTDSIPLIPKDFLSDPPMPEDMQIECAAVLPSTEAMGRALPDVAPGVAGSLKAGTGVMVGSGQGTLAERWLVVENVAFTVYTLAEPSDADKAWLNSIVTALESSR